MHRAMIERGIAQMFGARWSAAHRDPVTDFANLVGRVRTLFD
jgi:hypothetical protein